MEQIKTIQRSHSVEVNMYKQGLSTSHVFMNSESTNQQKISRIFSCFRLKQGRIFLLRSKMLPKLFIFSKKTLCSSFKRKQDIFREKNS